MSLKELKSQFLSIFRQLFVYHHRSLEFRCKLFAAMIVAGPEDREHMFDTLKEIAREIYGDDEARVEILVLTTKEYVQKVILDNGFNIDELLFSIDRELKKNSVLARKINLAHLKRLMWLEEDDINHLQIRVLEFMESEKRYFSTK